MNRSPPKAIVLVDDERSYTELMTQMLADNLDCTVHGFTRPLEALKSLPQIDPGVIVTDYFMPQLDGLEFIRQASAIVPHAVFVMITGHNLSREASPAAHCAIPSSSFRSRAKRRRTRSPAARRPESCRDSRRRWVRSA